MKHRGLIEEVAASKEWREASEPERQTLLRVLCHDLIHEPVCYQYRVEQLLAELGATL